MVVYRLTEKLAKSQVEKVSAWHVFLMLCMCELLYLKLSNRWRIVAMISVGQ